MRCPVCNEYLKNTYRDCLDGQGVLMESEDICPSSHYGKEFMTGYHSEWVRAGSFYAERSWSYTDNNMLPHRFAKLCKEAWFRAVVNLSRLRK